MTGSAARNIFNEIATDMHRNSSASRAAGTIGAHNGVVVVTKGRAITVEPTLLLSVPVGDHT